MGENPFSTFLEKFLFTREKTEESYRRPNNNAVFCEGLPGNRFIDKIDNFEKLRNAEICEKQHK